MSGAAKPEAGSSERLATLVDELDLEPRKKEMLRHRWLNQLGWMSRQAGKARRSYLRVRIPIVFGGVAIPALITILLGANNAVTISWLFDVQTLHVRLLAFAISVTVAVLAAIEDTMHYADRWRHYRRASELLKTLGWQYLMLNGAFKRYHSHEAAFGPFTERVEDVLNEDVEGYLSAVTAEGSDKRHEIVA
jgi:hypothetical protein